MYFSNKDQKMVYANYTLIFALSTGSPKLWQLILNEWLKLNNRIKDAFLDTRITNMIIVYKHLIFALCGGRRKLTIHPIVDLNFKTND